MTTALLGNRLNHQLPAGEQTTGEHDAASVPMSPEVAQHQQSEAIKAFAADSNIENLKFMLGEQGADFADSSIHPELSAIADEIAAAEAKNRVKGAADARTKADVLFKGIDDELKPLAFMALEGLREVRAVEISKQRELSWYSNTAEKIAGMGVKKK